jgi:Ca2+/Na+ antiporter
MKKPDDTITVMGAVAVGMFLLTLVSAIPAWITHVVHCISNSEFIFLLAGAIFFPIGIIHGWGLWFGWF